ncbi:UNVERIFIED_CONTAM: hypothetical protein GTU68_054124 [Idotea baltica]|nr:hypothetical protein [Idotea baltica]
MSLIICENPDRVANKAADIIRKQIAEKNFSVLGLATGNTQLKVYEKLIALYKKALIDFSKVRTFNLDEFLVEQNSGIKLEDPGLFKNYMNSNFFSKVNLNLENCSLLAPHVDKIEYHCNEYEKSIRAIGGIDLQLLGIGRNAHIAFNEPGSSFESRTREVFLEDSTIADTASFFGSRKKVPASILQNHKNITYVLDQDAASLLA